MAANYSKPVSTDLYSDILVYIKDNITDSIKFLDGSSATNIPSGAKRWNATLSRFEKFDGSTWTALIPDATTSISGLMSAADKTTISGLGTAASSTKQTSVTDTTSGRLMIVGAFGFGTSTPTQLSTASALNNIAITSVYYVASANVATVGGPSGAGAGVVFTQRYSSTYAVQTYSQVTGGFKSWSRQCNSGTWSSWVEELNTGSILASQIPQTSDYRFVSDSEKSTWNAKASTSVATTSTNGLMSSTDKTKLDTVSANAQKNSDILKSEIEAVLTGTISSHSHAAVPAASESTAGISELATAAETITGTDNTRSTHPAGVKAAIDSAIDTALSGFSAGDYVSGSKVLVQITPVYSSLYSSYGTPLPEGYPSVVPVVAYGQAGRVSDATYKDAYFWVADKNGEATFAISIAKNGSTASIKFMKNGTLIDAEISNSSTTYSTYTKTISFVVGDCISIQFKDNSSDSSAFAKDFKVLVG